MDMKLRRRRGGCARKQNFEDALHEKISFQSSGKRERSKNFMISVHWMERTHVAHLWYTLFGLSLAAVGGYETENGNYLVCI